MKKIIFIFPLVALLLTTACSETEPDLPKPYELVREDITFPYIADNALTVKVGQLIRIETQSISDEGVSYEWSLDGEVIAQTKNLEYMIETIGQYELVLTAVQGAMGFTYPIALTIDFGQIDPPMEGASPYITQVFDYRPAPGQFVNKLPKYEDGDTQETMNAKALAAIGADKRQMITLGSYGGYVTVGFDHTIENKEGLRDFRIIANAFYADANPDPNAPRGGSCEPGIIMVAYDLNDNGKPDDDEWYEIAGSSHIDATKEAFYPKAKAAGKDVNFYFQNYNLTYTKPSSEPDKEDYTTYISWTDNKGGKGYLPKNTFHSQPYYPQWITDEVMRFHGSRLPQNGVDESGEGNYFVLYRFGFGYADNAANNEADAAIDIDWAVDKEGKPVNLPGVDFIKIYCGVNQVNGWLGECSTEITGVEDLHLLKEEIKK